MHFRDDQSSQKASSLESLLKKHYDHWVLLLVIKNPNRRLSAWWTRTRTTIFCIHLCFVTHFRVKWGSGGRGEGRGRDYSSNLSWTRIHWRQKVYR